MMAVLATFAYVRVLILWSYWLFSKVAKVANISTGVKVAIFEFKHGHNAKVPHEMALVSGRNCAARRKLLSLAAKCNAIPRPSERGYTSGVWVAVAPTHVFEAKPGAHISAMRMLVEEL
jgi:hypothetical protein